MCEETMKRTRSDVPVLPEELVADILSRLPVKYLCQFKCVSHSWLALISDPHFAKTHFTRNNHNNMSDRRLILISDSHALFSVDFSTDVPVAKKLDFPSFQVESCNVWSEILGSCDGLILAYNKAIGAKYLLNPSTRESTKLPISPFAIRPYHLYGLGYDSSTDDYKVVMLSYYAKTSDEESESEGTTTDTNTIVSVYSLKTDSWRSIQGSSYLHTAGKSTGVCVNGGLHWLANNRGKNYFSFIAAFDLATESFQELPLPPSSGTFLWCSLAVVGGCLCFLTSQNCAKTNVWIMKEYGVKESWTKFTICETNIFIMELVCSLESGEFLLAMDEKKLVVYDPNEETKREMVVCGIPTMFTARGTYVESLVSPDYGNRTVRRFEGPITRMKRILQVTIEAHKAWIEEEPIQILDRRDHVLRNKTIPLVKVLWRSHASKKATWESEENMMARYPRSFHQASSSASASTLIWRYMDNHSSLSRCLDLLKSIQIVEGPVYEEVLKIFEDPLWRKVFIMIFFDRKRF